MRTLRLGCPNACHPDTNRAGLAAKAREPGRRQERLRRRAAAEVEAPGELDEDGRRGRRHREHRQRIDARGRERAHGEETREDDRAAQRRPGVRALRERLHLREPQDRRREQERRQRENGRPCDPQRAEGKRDRDGGECHAEHDGEDQRRPVQPPPEVREQRRVQSLEVEVDQLRPVEARAHGRRHAGDQDGEPLLSRRRGGGDDREDDQAVERHRDPGDARREDRPDRGEGRRSGQPANASARAGTGAPRARATAEDGIERHEPVRGDAQQAVRSGGVADGDGTEGERHHQFGHADGPRAQDRDKEQQRPEAQHFQREDGPPRPIDAPERERARVVGPNRQVHPGARDDGRDREIDRCDATARDGADHDPRDGGRDERCREPHGCHDPPGDLAAHGSRRLEPVQQAHARPQDLQCAPPAARDQAAHGDECDDREEPGRAQQPVEHEDLHQLDDRRGHVPDGEEPQPEGEVAREPSAEERILEAHGVPFALGLPGEPALERVFGRHGVSATGLAGAAPDRDDEEAGGAAAASAAEVAPPRARA